MLFFYLSKFTETRRVLYAGFNVFDLCNRGVISHHGTLPSSKVEVEVCTFFIFLLSSMYVINGVCMLIHIHVEIVDIEKCEEKKNFFLCTLAGGKEGALQKCTVSTLVKMLIIVNGP